MTFDPGAPRRWFTASFSPMLRVDSPLIFAMRSYFLIPARPAGVPGIGFMTVSCWSRIEMTIPSPPNWPVVVRLISLYSSGDIRPAVRVERVEHPVAGGVFDVAQVDLGAAQAVLQEGEDVAEARAHVPGALHVVDAELLLLRVDPHLHGGRSLVVDDDDLGALPLDRVQRRQEHLLRLHALRVDVAVADRLQHLVHDAELREVVGAGGVRRLERRVVRGDGRGEPVPQAATAVEVDREVEGDGERAEERGDLGEPFDEAHPGKYRRAERG